MRSSLAAFAGLLFVYGEKSCKKSVRFSSAKQSNKQIELSLHRPGGDEVQDREIMDILRQNPESGVRVLMELYARLIYTVVRSRLPGDMFCTAEVEDCVADTFDDFYLSRDNAEGVCPGGVPPYPPDTGVRRCEQRLSHCCCGRMGRKDHRGHN